VGMVLIAGETSIMDLDDITPRAIKAVGGEIVHHGVPVEPGNLLLLAYWEQTPIVGAPGCARSNQFNVVDMVLPRLASGERLSRRDLAALGHGGYLK
ncbi:MAG: molybdopterin-binding protein, partial [Anaerolineae bacterium]|nr:molybdopterin-binding protein [Anaerolineae bacterium]